MIPPEILKLAAEKGMESAAMKPKFGDIPSFADKSFPDLGANVPSFEKDSNIPKFAEDDCAVACDNVVVSDNEASSGSEAEQSSGDDTGNDSDGDENTEVSEDGYQSWEDVPHETDPATGREKYELQSGKDADALNSVPPPANADIYVKDADGQNYTKVEIDDKGRIVKITRPRIELSDKSQRTNETLNTIDKKDGRRDADGKKLDDGGHLVADEFGGSSEETNLVPMDSKVNQHGAWRKMERGIEKELKKEPPAEIKDFEVDIEYDDDSARPSRFTVYYTVDDGKSKTEISQSITNTRPEGEDVRNAA